MFDIYKMFFKKIKLNKILEVKTTSEINNNIIIPALIKAQIDSVSPIFVDRISKMNKDTSKKILRHILSGYFIDKIKINDSLSETSYSYGIYSLKNTTPVLIFSKDQTETDRIEYNFTDILFKLDFKSKVIDDVEFNKYFNIIKDLSDNDVSYVLINMVSYGLSDDVNDKENTESSVSTLDIIKDFYNNCCKKSTNNNILTTNDLFKSFQSYTYKKHNIFVDDSKKSDFSKKFKNVSNITPIRTSKTRGYKGIVLVTDIKKLSQQEINSNAENNTKTIPKTSFDKAFQKISNIDIKFQATQ